MNFTFIMEDFKSGGSVTMTLQAEHLEDLLQNFGEFVRGVGFAVDHKQVLVFVDEDLT